MLEKNRDSEVHVEKVESRATASIAFGLERIGLVAVKAPILSCIVLVALIIGAVFGIERIKIDDSLSQLFRSNSKEYQQYEAETKRFPAELPQGADYDTFIGTVKTNEIIRGKLLSEDGTLALIVLSIEPDVVASSKLGKVVGDIRKLMADDLARS